MNVMAGMGGGGRLRDVVMVQRLERGLDFCIVCMKWGGRLVSLLDVCMEKELAACSR